MAGENSDPYYDLIDDFDLIVSSFQSQYGLRLSRELNAMKWSEFSDMLKGISPDTALGRIVSIRAEEDPKALENFSPEMNRIRDKWRQKRAKNMSAEERDKALESLKQAFIDLAGGVGN